MSASSQLEPVVSVVLAACAWTGDEAVARTVYADSADALPGRLRSIPVFAGADVETLPDGSVLIVVRGDVDARAAAEQAAGCAVRLRDVLGGAPIAIATGAQGDALEKAAALLSGAPGAIRLDAATAALLGEKLAGALALDPDGPLVRGAMMPTEGGDAPETQRELRAGDRVAHFVIEGLLGRGGMGHVYRAHDTRLERSVAVKLLGGSAMASHRSGDGVARVWREARAAAAFNHPNAVSVYEIGDADGSLYIAMEIVEGQPLRRFVGDASVPWKKRLAWLLDIARALGAAHAVGLVHRDVKPENVMVRADGVVKVLDFGIARRVSQSPSPAATTLSAVAAAWVPGTTPTTGKSPVGSTGPLTAEGTVVGTPFYIAPEQALGASVDGRADQFSWGVTAYELLTGELPWGHDLGRAMACLIRAEPPRPMGARAPELPAALEAAVARTLSKDPEGRFASMDELVRALASLAVEDAPPVKREASAPYSPARKPAPVAAIAATLALTVALGTALFVSRRGGQTLALAPSAIPSSAPPISTVPEAAAAYAAGMRNWRAGSSTRGQTSMERASKLDPLLSGATLRQALWTVLERPLAAGSVDPQAARELFKRADAQRATATPYDRAFLDALEPRFRQTPDPIECERRLAALAGQYPDQGEPPFWLAMSRSERGDAAAAHEAAERAMQIEPELRPAGLALSAWIDRASPSVAIATLDRCLAAAPESTDCLGARARLRGFAGQCEGMEADARAWVAADRESPTAFFTLGEALNARGASVDGVREAFASGEALLSPEERPNIAAHGAYALLLLSGDFDAALAQARRFEDGLPQNAILAWRFVATTHVIDAALEGGRDAVAGEAALRFLKRVDAWTPSSAAEIAMPAAILAVARRTGAVSRPTFERERARWLARAEATVAGRAADDTVRRLVWLYGYASLIDTPDDAREAVAALGRYPQPSSPDQASPSSAGMIGRLFLRAGELERAIPYLRRAAAGCFVINDPATSYRARLHLADALVQSGRGDEAPTLYREILRRWGDAKPRSVTAEASRAALAKLGPGGPE